jgi:hypothetical protein
MGKTQPYIAPMYEKKKRFWRRALGVGVPIYIWAPYMKRKKALISNLGIYNPRSGHIFELDYLSESIFEQILVEILQDPFTIQDP